MDSADARIVSSPTPLSKRLREGTLEAHRAAETGRFLHEFVKGNITKRAYQQYLVNLHHIYNILEEELDERWEHELLEPIYFPEELHRAAALRADAKYHIGDNWPDMLEPSPGAVAYAARIREIGKSAPELLVAHTYTRYLGDLSGGVVLKRGVVRGLKLAADGDGTRFYDFRRIPKNDFKRFKDMYRARLDSLPVTESGASAIVEEANRAFSFNGHMFAELEELSDFPLRKQLDIENLESKASRDNAACAVCPFAHLVALGVAMPQGHCPLPGSTPQILKSEMQGQQSTPCRWACPLQAFGRNAPKLAAVILPFAVGLAAQGL